MRKASTAAPQDAPRHTSHTAAHQESWWRRFNLQVAACSGILQGYDRRRCFPVVGAIQEDGSLRERVMSEPEEVACVLFGSKPLALLHSRRGVAHSNAQTCLAQMWHGGDDEGGDAPVLVALPKHHPSAMAAIPLLRQIGAWRASPPGTMRESQAHSELSDLQAHIALGALLGYGYGDLKGLHCLAEGNDNDFLLNSTIAARYLSERSCETNAFREEINDG